MQQQRRLLEKQQRMDAIISSAEEQLSAEQKMEIEETLTPSEKAQLAKVKHVARKLQQCETQLCDTLFVFSMYIKYAHLK
jgi:DNA-directed RNA polymerase III subunit RPC3